ncbi:MAG: MAE_28990/MAE_18760 family HEPN-like nuclease [Candidatus Kapabacteria bacterium]|nr:MAE_28990/MAE_18760 family HEPN-like nuclease [Candidatus Kapabacteria bacterium]
MTSITHAFRNDFNQRVHEVNVYFEFLSHLKIKAVLEYETSLGQQRTNVQGELVPILKANGFLLLYNLVESSCREAFRAIYDTVNSEQMHFENAAETIQKLWIKQIIGGKTKPENTLLTASAMIDFILTQQIIEFDEKYVKRQLLQGFRGNIDAKGIRGLAAEYGFSSTLPTGREQLGDNLLEIKDRRQDLAHGLKTFSECGRKFTEDEMMTYKTNIVEYLDAILTNIETFLNQKHYKKTTLTP